MYIYVLTRQKFGYFGHWLSDVNTLEMKNFDKYSVFICKLYIANQKFQPNPKILTVDFSGQQINLRSGKVSFATMPEHTFGSLNE